MADYRQCPTCMRTGEQFGPIREWDGKVACWRFRCANPRCSFEWARPPRPGDPPVPEQSAAEPIADAQPTPVP